MTQDQLNEGNRLQSLIKKNEELIQFFTPGGTTLHKITKKTPKPVFILGKKYTYCDVNFRDIPDRVVQKIRDFLREEENTLYEEFKAICNPKEQK